MTPPVIDSWWKAPRKERLLGSRISTRTDPRSFTRNGRCTISAFDVAATVCSGLSDMLGKVWQRSKSLNSYERTTVQDVSSIAFLGRLYLRPSGASPPWEN